MSLLIPPKSIQFDEKSFRKHFGLSGVIFGSEKNYTEMVTVAIWEEELPYIHKRVGQNIFCLNLHFASGVN